MKVHLFPPDTPSMALDRIYAALARWAPPRLSFVPYAEAELVLFSVVGRRDAMSRKIDAAVAAGKQIAIFQVCVRSTQKPHTEDWRALWDSAALIWSFYDLDALVAEDGCGWRLGDRFYHAPLGTDPAVFCLQTDAATRPFLICTSGRAWTTESVRECAWAVKANDGAMLHLGENLRRDWITCVRGVPDAELAALYGQCQFVSGLRRTEGFELPALEGLLCGARPVFFNRDHYRHWFGDLAVYIEEGPRAEVFETMTALLHDGPRPVRPDERDAAVERFAWPTIVHGLWSRL